MRTRKLLPILATTIAAGILALAITTSNTAFAQTSYIFFKDRTDTAATTIDISSDPLHRK
jgi:hypothetical protein